MRDQEGEVVIKPIYDDIKEFSCSIAAVCKDGKWGYIYEDGSQCVDFLYDDANNMSKEWVAPVKLNENPNSWALLSASGDLSGHLIKMQNSEGYYSIGDFNDNGYAIAKLSKFYCIIDEYGNQDDELYYSLKYLKEQGVFRGEVVKNHDDDAEIKILNSYGEEIAYEKSGLLVESDKTTMRSTVHDDRLYKFTIEFNENLMNIEEVKAFVETEFTGSESVEIISLNGYTMELLWKISHWEEYADLEISLFYTLDDYRYGTYSSKLIKSSKEIDVKKEVKQAREKMLKC